jgi:hypothetical protein
MIKHLGVLLKACFYREGAIAALLMSLALYGALVMTSAYVSKNNPLWALIGVLLFGITAVTTVMMPGQIRAIKTRKIFHLLPNIDLLLLGLGFAICLFSCLFMLPYFYVLGMRELRSLTGVFILLLWLYSLIMMAGLLLAKYITPAILFIVIIMVVPSLAIADIHFFQGRHGWLAALLLPLVWLAFGYSWLRSATPEPLDDGRNWARRLCAAYSALTHSAVFASAEGTYLLGKADGLSAIVKRSCILNGFCVGFWVLLSGITLLFSAQKFGEIVRSQVLLYLFFMIQFVYLDTAANLSRLKSVWLLVDGDRRELFKRRALLLVRFAGIHYGLTLVVIAIMPASHEAWVSPAHAGILFIIFYYMFLHVFCLWRMHTVQFVMSPLLIMGMSFGGRLLVITPEGSFGFSGNYLELALVVVLPLAYVVICLLQKSNVSEFDFCTRPSRTNLWETQ